MAFDLLNKGTLACLCAAGLSLGAEAPHLGLQVTGSAPTGSMRTQFTDGTGVGLGVFADWEVDAGKTIRLAYDGILYPNKRDQVNLASVGSVQILSTDNNRKPHSNAVTLQYLLFPNRDNEGFYFMAGLGAMKYQEKIESTVRLADTTVQSLDLVKDSGTKLACVAGMGYEFGKNWGVSAKYSFITVDNHTLGAAQAGISYRF